MVTSIFSALHKYYFQFLLRHTPLPNGNQSKTEVKRLYEWRGALAWQLGNPDSVAGSSPDSQLRHSVRQKLQHRPPKKTLKSTEKNKKAQKNPTMNPSQALLLKIK